MYQDDELGNNKSVTIRLYIQSDTNTLQESDIESVVQSILNKLADEFKATLR